MNKQLNNLLVIKIGTSTLTKRNGAGLVKLDIESFTKIGKQVIDLQKSGYNVVLVSSAAITGGMAVTGLATRPTNVEASMPTLQGLASIGWRHVLNAWDDALGSLIIGELLITKHELELESERSELLRVTHNLMANNHIAIINENDAITHDEIAFGDNDTLAALFATKLKQSKLFGDKVSVVILSDVDGVYKDINDQSTVIRQINNIDDYKQVAKSQTGDGGTGGMVTKFNAAKTAHASSVNLYITNGRADNTIFRALNNEIGTHFSA